MSSNDESSRAALPHRGQRKWDEQDIRRRSRRTLDPGEGVLYQDEQASVPVQVLPTGYAGSQLTLLRSSDPRKARREDKIVAVLKEAGEKLHWKVNETEDARTKGLPVGVRIITLTARPGYPAPDAWRLLQLARALSGRKGEPFGALTGAVLDHTVSPVAPFFQPNTVFHEPNTVFHEPNTVFHEPNPVSGLSSTAVATYLSAGSGGRQPVAYVGPPPSRRPDADFKDGRRPVVAMLDTGVWANHPWFLPGPVERRAQDHVVETDVRLADRPGNSGRIGLGHEAWQKADEDGPFDGALSGIAGHGTFVAGLILQKCPDVTVLSWRVVPPDGEMQESELLIALCQILEMVRTKQRAIDVLNLSLSYYHETPNETDLLDVSLRTLLELLGKEGVTVVCSVGNDATDRPAYPAAFGPWLPDKQGKRPSIGKKSEAPIVSVGAFNPDGRVDALFSNVGRWVRHYERGAAILSTFPKVQGGYQPVARTWVEVVDNRRARSSMDPDDFRSGFAVWSGTSFAAPVTAGRLATCLHDRRVFGKRQMPTARMAWAAVAKVTDGEITMQKDT